MNTEEVAKKVVELTRKQAWYEALDTLYDDNVVSVEASGMRGGTPETRGEQGVPGKSDWALHVRGVHCVDVHVRRSPHSNPRKSCHVSCSAQHQRHVGRLLRRSLGRGGLIVEHFSAITFRIEICGA